MQSIQSVGILSCAKILGIVHATLGLLVLPVVFFMIVVSAISGGFGGHPAAGLGVAVAGGLLLVVLIPLFYGAMGFAFGALGAWAYNLAARKFGGIQIELRDASSGNSSTIGLL